MILTLGMPFSRPSLGDLVSRIRGDLRGRLEIDNPLLRRAMADVLGAVWAGGVHLLYGAIDFLSRQLFGTTAERAQLLKLAAMYGIFPDAATFSTGNVTATGTNGATVPTNTIIRLDAVTAYNVTAGQVIASGTATLPVTAVLAGAAGNLPAGTSLTLQTPIPGVSSSLVVAVGDLSGGDDGDDGDAGTERVRARLLARLQTPPQGGADQDYIAWAELVAGVTRVWVYPNENGLGTVVVRFVRDNDVSIFPDPTEVAAVQASIDANRPITVVATAAAPTQLAVAFSLHLAVDTTDARSAVTAELGDLFTRLAQPGNAGGTIKILLTAIRSAIGRAIGDEADYTLATPSADVVPGLGQLPTVGTVTFT